MSKDCVRVLLVEDSPSDARLLCEALRDYPLQRFEIELAERLDEAIAWLSRQSFDVILLDLSLPDSSGMETCRQVSRVAGQVPIIVLTVADDEVVAAEAMCLGVQDYLVKGQAYGSAIGRAIRYAVERSQAQQALRQANERLHEQAKVLQDQAEELHTQAEELATVNATLRASEDRLHLAMEAGKVGVWEWEAGTERAEWSQGVYALLGYEPGAAPITRDALRRRIHPQDLARYDQTLKDSLERCEDYLCEFRVVWADGSVHWIEARGQYAYIDDEIGVILRMRGVLSDIDGRKQAEEALRESMEKYRTLFDSIDEGFCIIEMIFDGDGRPVDYCFLEVNPAFERQTGLHEAQGQRMRTLAPDHEAHWFEIYGRIALTGEPARFTNEARALHRWYDVYAFRVGEPQGRRVAILFNDITERRRTEEAIRRSERQFKSTFENAAIGIAHVALDGHILQFNSRFCEISGCSPEEIVGKTCEQITFADDWKAERVQMQRLLEGQVDHYAIEKRYVCPDGSFVWLNLTRSIQRDEAGQSEYFIVLVEDITERKQAEEALRELTSTLESKVTQRTAELKHRTRQLQKLALEMSEAEDRERERLAHILHDDLQQVLAAAKFHLGIVRSRIKYDSSVLEIATQVNEMLKDAIGKSRSLSYELSPGVLRQDDFAEIFRWLADEMQAKHGLTVRVQGQARAQSDAIKAFLYRTARELLFNAVKHAEVQEARVRVRQCGGYICLSVSDRGRGFDPEELREAAGFGLLSIRERIELLGGRMKIRSAPGKGSTFFVVVPNRTEVQDAVGVGRVPKRDESRLGSPPHAYPTSGGPEGPPLRVLLADDHEIVRQGLAALLSDEDAVEIVGEAANGREAVDLADQLHPDVVIMDMSMPVMSGDEATRRIKSQSPQTRVVALSMFEDAEVRDKMYQAGAESYVLKTAPSEELLAAVRGQSPETLP